MKRALLSVSDKRGLIDFAKGLIENNYEIISTGGTLKFLTEAGVKAKAVEEITGFPEILDGRVKTLHPKIHAALLAKRENSEHMKTLKDHDITPIDLLVVNLYPFKETIEKKMFPMTKQLKILTLADRRCFVLPLKMLEM